MRKTIGVCGMAAGLLSLAIACAADRVAGPSAGATSQIAGGKSLGGGKFAGKAAFEDDFLPGWEKEQKGWRVATWKQNGTLMSPDRCATDGKGLLVQTVLAGEPYKGGSVQTAKEYPYGRWVARVKPSSVAGVNNSVFTKDWDDLTTPDNDHDGSGFEVDIEFLTYTFGKGKGQVHLAIHAQGKANWFKDDVELNFNPSEEFHVWGFDILPDGVTWHVDGKELRAWKVPGGEKVPVGGHEFFFNSWTSPKWVKGPPKEEARYLIDWVQFYPLKK